LNAEVKEHQRSLELESESSLKLAKQQEMATLVAALSKVTLDLSLLPIDPEPMMPTRLGNVLKRAELYGRRIYGLDTITMWEELIASVPDRLASAVSDYRTHLDMFIAFWLIAVGFATSAIICAAAGVISTTLAGLLVLGALISAYFFYLCSNSSGEGIRG
jgi:hypothetical protein